MLDDMNVIAQRDPDGALEYAASQPEQLQHDFGFASHDFGREFKNIAFCGMGGSALSAELARTFPKVKVPFVISKEYNLPAFADADTLVIASSYSGNTEESISALEQAAAKGLTIVVIAHGGKLGDIARERGYAYVELPEAKQPRMGVFAAYRALLEILVAAKLSDASVLDELNHTADFLIEKVATWVASVPTEQNDAKQLAGKLAGKTPIIYGGPEMFPAAYKWKISANENAKNTAWCNFIPEMNHNEFIGWSSHPVEKPFAVIDLVSSFEHERVLKRFEVADRLLSGMRPKSTTVNAEGDSALQHMLYLVLLGDFSTLYLALLNGVNPTPVDLVEKFKKELG
jgi:glucose/mannose-6-phosphate isomerase